MGVLHRHAKRTKRAGAVVSGDSYLNGNPVGNGSGGSIASTDITDSTSVGRAVLTATDAAAARTALGVAGLSISKTFAFSGGAHDYTADAAYAPAGLTVAGASIAPTSRLGDGTSVPHFAFYGRASVAALDRTTVPSLRVTAAASDTGDCWPFAAGGANALIWLPDACEITIDLTIAGNPDAAAIVGGGYARMVAALVQYAPSDARPRTIVSDAAYATGGGITEAWQVDSDAGSAGSTARTSTAGVLALDLRIIVRDAEVELWSALAGGTLVRRIWQSNPYRRGSKRDMALLLAVAQTGITPVAGLYAELRALSIAGARAPF